MVIRRFAMRLQEAQVALDKESGGATTRVIDRHTWLRIEDAGHDAAHVGRGVELTRTLTLTFGELAYQVFIGLPKEIGLNIL
jgi:hypothetical protein